MQWNRPAKNVRGVLWTWPDMWSVHAQPVKQVALILDVGLWPTFCLRRVEHIFTIARSDQFNQGWGEVHANESSHGDLCTVWVLVKVDSSRFEHQDFHLQSVCQNIKQSSCNHHKGFFWTLISPSQPYTVRSQRKLFPQKKRECLWGVWQFIFALSRRIVWQCTRAGPMP